MVGQLTATLESFTASHYSTAARIHLRLTVEGNMRPYEPLANGVCAVRGGLEPLHARDLLFVRQDTTIVQAHAKRPDGRDWTRRVVCTSLLISVDLTCIMAWVKMPSC